MTILFEYPKFIIIPMPMVIHLEEFDKKIEMSKHTTRYCTICDKVYYVLGLITDIKDGAELKKELKAVGKKYIIDFIEYINETYLIHPEYIYGIVYDVSANILFYIVIHPKRTEIIWKE